MPSQHPHQHKKTHQKSAPTSNGSGDHSNTQALAESPGPQSQKNGSTSQSFLQSHVDTSAQRDHFFSLTDPVWVPEAIAGEQLAIKKSTLRCMRRERRIRPGLDWIYSTGCKNSSVLYNVHSIIELQMQRTIEIAREEDQKRQTEAEGNRLAIETYDEPDSGTPTGSEA